MTAHKHAEMIKAKADNMELVVFVREERVCSTWDECETEVLPGFHEGLDYFLCIPKHKEACLNWLNGGESQVSIDGCEHIVSCGNIHKWSGSLWYMAGHGYSRAKPAKQKRWVVYNSKGEFCSEHDYKYVPVDETLQIIEIEVEV